MIVSMSRIDKLLGRMTLAEKLGQLTMTAAGYAVTGPVIAGDSTRLDPRRHARQSAEPRRREARARDAALAVEESRLGIPLLIGFDVIHGHRTLFPVPLAEAATFDPRIWELTAREAARETAADGLAMTFAPMLDVSRDRAGAARSKARARIRGWPRRSRARRCADSRAPISPPRESVAATAKHFCAYGPVTGGPRIRLGRHLRAHTARSASAGVRRRGARRRRRRSCRHSPISPAFR